MPEIKVYLPEDLYKRLSRKGNKSKVIQDALRRYYAFNTEAWKARVLARVAGLVIKDPGSVLVIAEQELGK